MHLQQLAHCTHSHVQISSKPVLNNNHTRNLLLAACRASLLVLACTFTISANAQFTWTQANGTITITGYSGLVRDLTIPSKFNGLPVTAIGNNPYFRYASAITNVTIPSSVTSIGEDAFANCSSLPDMVIPNTVTQLGAGVFEYCTSLTNVTLPNNLTSLGQSFFAGCTGLQNYAVPANVTDIGAEAFYGCTSLLSVTVPTGVTNVGYAAFANCSALGGIQLPDSVISLGSSMFYGCSNLSWVILPAGITSIPAASPSDIGGMFQYCIFLTSFPVPNTITNIGDLAFANCTGVSSVAIPGSVKEIGASAFYYSSLTSVTISDGVSSIDISAFGGCIDLPSVAIPASVTNIGAGAFAYCTGLTNILVDASNSNYGTANGVLFTKDQTALVQYPAGLTGPYDISNGVTSIGDFSFNGCLDLTAVTIPNTVTNIGQWAFESCIGLTNIAIPASVATIGDVAFRDCDGLKAFEVDDANADYSSVDGVLFNKDQSVLIQYPAAKIGNYTVPSTVESIGDWAFSDCSGLARVIIPDSITNIDEEAFWGCTSLTSAIFLGNPPSETLELFGEDSNAEVYYVPGTTGWAGTFGDAPAILWNPQIQIQAPNFGIGSNGFGFTIAGSSNLVVAVEACTNLANPTWLRIGTNTLIAGTSVFSDPGWTNFPSRFYRLSAP